MCDEIISTVEVEQRVRKLETLVTLLVEYINRCNINNAINANYLQLLSLSRDEVLHRNKINYEVRNHVNHDDKVREPLMPFLWQDRCRRILELKVKSSILVLWIWRKLLIGCQEK